jgi:hypothetical protein
MKSSARELGVTQDTAIKWKVREKIPIARNMKDLSIERRPLSVMRREKLKRKWRLTEGKSGSK